MKNAIIFCAGQKGREAFSYLSEQGYQVLGYVDNNAEMTGATVNGVKVYNPTYILEHPECDVIIAVATPAPIVRHLEKLNVKNQILLYSDAFNQTATLVEVKNFDYTLPWMEYVFQKNPEYQKELDDLCPSDSELYRKVFSIIQMASKQFVDRNMRLLEIGCGGGQFAQLLFKNGFLEYTGIDISQNAIAISKSHNMEYQDRFFVADGTDFLSKNNYDMVIMMEVLEHIKDDIELIQTIKPETYCCCTLPNFTSFNHYRTFNNLDEIKFRYEQYLEILHYDECNISKKNKYLVFWGKKK